MTGPYFVDSKVLVCARDPVGRAKRDRAMAWLDSLWRFGEGRLSVRVLNEFYAVVNRGEPNDEVMRVTREDCMGYQVWSPEALDFRLIEHAQTMQDRFRLKLY